MKAGRSSGVQLLRSSAMAVASVTSGAQPGTQTYYPYGGVRTTSGTLPNGIFVTDYTFTGQKSLS